MNKGQTESDLPCFTIRDVAHHCEVDSCWITISDLVYDVTNFIREHPGGEDIMMEHAGADATVAFLDKGHSRDAVEMLRDYLVGQLVKKCGVFGVDVKAVIKQMIRKICVRRLVLLAQHDDVIDISWKTPVMDLAIDNLS